MRRSRTAETLRSPRYVVPLVVLLGVAALALALSRAAPGGAGEQAVATPTASATATATQPAASAADARRRADLATLARLLETYRERHGSYPSTGNYFNTVCTQAFDAGCLLTTITKQLPATDGTYPYWYRSDGASYTLYARADAQPADGACPAEIPPALAGNPVICLQSGGGR